jgi:hypothetical protein
MSKFHLLETNGSTTVCFHIPIPSGNNVAGCEWCECVKLSDKFDNTTCLPDCDHEDDINDGKIIEVKEAFKYSRSNLTNQEKLAELEARFLEVQTKTLENVEKTLLVFGYKSTP